MYQKRDLRVLKILQKAREFADNDLSNESLVSQLVNSSMQELNNEEKTQIITFLNDLIASKDKALLSSK